MIFKIIAPAQLRNDYGDQPQQKGEGEENSRRNVAAQRLRVAHDVAHELSRLKDLHAVELCHERMRAKESTVVTPMLSPQVVRGHEHRHLVPSYAFAYHLEQRTVTVNIEPFVEDL